MLFPNPTTGRLTIRRESDAPAEMDVRVVDPLGREVRSAQLRGSVVELDLGGLPGGCYGVLVSTADGVWSGRVLKE